MSALLRTAIALLILMISTATSASAIDAGPVHQCGAFVSYEPANATRSGTLIIGATTYATSSGNPAPFRQIIGAGVVSGASVCLDGTVVRSDTSTNPLLADFVVGVTTSVTAPSQLPSTATDPVPSAPPATMLLLALLLVTGLVARRRA